MAAVDDLLAPFRAAPEAAAIVLDFDGTLAPIVDDPAAASPLPGVPEVLTELRAGGWAVTVVSGRPVAFLARHLPPEVPAVGLYGLERLVDGVVLADPVAAEWQPVVDEAVTRAVHELPPDVEVEHKGRSLTLHFRRVPQREAEVASWAAQAAADTGLEVRGAKMSIELHPPVGVDKGTVVDELVAGRSAAMFVGDDVGDLPAFDALDRFAAAGGHAVRVLVRTPETATQLVGRADLEVDGPDGALELLSSLRPR